MREPTAVVPAAFFLISVLLCPAPGRAQDYPPAVGELVARARAQVRTIDAAAFKAGLEANALGLIVDVREPGEYAQGHIPGAVNIPRGQIEMKIWPHVGYPDATDLDRRITLYCRSGARAVLSAKSLQDLGFRNAVAADMHLDDWAKDGQPLVKDSAAAGPR